MSDDLKYQILTALEANPKASQRELAAEVGISLGRTNYCLRALIDKGWVKARNFKNSKNKAAYMYNLTPSGIAAKAQVARAFLAKKQAEYEALEQEIEQLRQEVEESPDSQFRNPETVNPKPNS
ncbi:MarR family EPS-associated transcriptional regulator [Wenzhouxiangella sp. XN79A]|nr:MarR family EPS-associated transcriptional regulator [Wenzhouxiangella sp. XN79A]